MNARDSRTQELLHGLAPMHAAGRTAWIGRSNAAELQDLDAHACAPHAHMNQAVLPHSSAGRDYSFRMSAAAAAPGGPPARGDAVPHAVQDAAFAPTLHAARSPLGHATQWGSAPAEAAVHAPQHGLVESERSHSLLLQPGGYSHVWHVEPGSAR